MIAHSIRLCIAAALANAAVFGFQSTAASEITSSSTPPLVSKTLQPLSAFANIKDRKARSVALFEEIGKVVEHPRCLNCHPSTDRPTQTDAMRPHNPVVVRGKDGRGVAALHCASCHQAANFAPASVPGDPKWSLAAADMAWQGKTLGQICAQLKDLKRNGGRDMKALTEHMADDHLVGWGWHPGGNLTPVPGTQSAFGVLFREWVRTGSACPSGK